MRMGFAVGMGRNEKIFELGSHAQVAEESGFAHLTVGDVQNCTRDLYVKMAMAAINTRRIQIGSGVTLPVTRHPAITATAHATVAELAGGRVFIGFGTGGPSLSYLGLKPPTLKRLREEVDFFRQYMTGADTEFNGVSMHSEWVRNTVPIYISAEGPRALTLAGEIADGVYIMGGPPELVKWKIDHVYRGAEAAGRDPTKLDICSRSYIYVADSKEEARRETASYTASAARDTYLAIFSRNTPEAAELADRLEEVEPGAVEEFKVVYDNFDHYQHEKTDAPHAKLVTQRVIDMTMLTGRPEDIIESIAKIGETVSWKNKDSAFHSVTSGYYENPDGLFDSGHIDPDEKFSYTFTEPGVYSYYCTLHPWMNGMIKVER